jgi:hypothetical protein
MHRSRVAAAASITLAFALCSTWARAALPEIDVSGFGTAGFAVTDNGKGEFGRVQQQAVGANNEGDIGVDSLFALQGTVHLTDMFSATVQGMVRRMFNTGFQLDIPVFFVKAEVTRDLSVRVGRIQLPVFMLSDYRQVGYSSTWVRPPIEVYGQIPLDSDDGVDILYRKTVGPADISAQAFSVPLKIAAVHYRGGSKVFYEAWVPFELRADGTVRGYDLAPALKSEVLRILEDQPAREADSSSHDRARLRN